MKEYTIKKMSKKLINKWLCGIDKLIGHYTKMERSDRCGLCTISIDMLCGDCIWKIIEGKSCAKFAKDLYGPSSHSAEYLRDNLRFKKWRLARIPMLRRWKKILKAELARRENCTQ